MAGFDTTPDICEQVAVYWPDAPHLFAEWEECAFTDLFTALDQFTAEVEPEAFTVATAAVTLASYSPSFGDRLTPNTSGSWSGGSPSLPSGPWIITPDTPTDTHGEIPTMPTPTPPIAPVPLPESGALLALALMLAWLAVNMKGRSHG